jgi:DNA helicase-2/ATP-dependent DNA helicase PcrA
MSEDGNISGLSKGDRLFFMENMARAKMITLEKYWDENWFEDINWYELERLSKTMLAYKAANGKQDFTDIIYSFNSQPVVPRIKALIVDEAQDLTPLQWQMIEHLARDVEEIYIAGDDDQAIFKWAGADVDHFMAITGQRMVLPLSYRVPKAIQIVAENIAKQITKRIPKVWQPTTEEGTVTTVTDLSNIDMSKGTWLLLGRNLFMLQQYNDYCMQMGWVFDSHIGSPIKSASLAAIVSWEDLRKGKPLIAKLVKEVYDYMSIKEKIKYGSKSKLDKVPDDKVLTIDVLKQDYGLLTNDIWHKALDKIPEAESGYFLSALRRGEKLLKEPRIKINTIHSVKGGESDNVVLVPDMATRTWNEFQSNPDDEHRVWYVAVTRAKHNLYILTPKTDKAYNI